MLVLLFVLLLLFEFDSCWFSPFSLIIISIILLLFLFIDGEIVELFDELDALDELDEHDGEFDALFWFCLAPALEFGVDETGRSEIKPSDDLAGVVELGSA